MSNLRSHVVLYSGGPDSLITLRYVETEFKGDEIIPMYFDLGHRYAAREMESIVRTVPTTRVDQVLRRLGILEDENAHIENRNAFLVLAAARYLGDFDGVIWLSVQKDEMSIPDRSMNFFDGMTGLLGSLYPAKRVQVATPWSQTDKTDMVRLYLERGFSVEHLYRTTSCYRPTGSYGCGDCPACFRRYVAFYLNGLEENYVIHPLDSVTSRQYREAALDGKYSEKRNARILSVFGE